MHVSVLSSYPGVRWSQFHQISSMQISYNSPTKLCYCDLLSWKLRWIAVFRVNHISVGKGSGHIKFRVMCRVEWWSGVVKVSCILRLQGVQLILAYSWARPAILVAGKGRGGMFLFLLLYTIIPVFLSSLSLSFISSTISSISFLHFSGRRHKMTHKGWPVVKPQLSQSIWAASREKVWIFVNEQHRFWWNCVGAQHHLNLCCSHML